jgi:hypothetical protein
MLQIFKKFMAFLTLISVLSSTAWAFSPEVLFDDSVTAQTVKQDIHLIQRSAMHSGKEVSNTTLPESFCNHACHISAHILGIVTAEATNQVLPLDTTIYNVESNDQFTNPVLKSLYRPPALV